MALDYADRSIAPTYANPTQRTFGLLARGDALGGLERWDEASSAYAEVCETGRQSKVSQLIATALAGLARAALSRDQAQAARELADEILTLLASERPASVYEPLRTYETCYRALAACGDQRAPDVLRTAYTTLMQQADSIDEPDWRRSFLENVAAHRALIAEAERLGLADHDVVVQP